MKPNQVKPTDYSQDNFGMRVNKEGCIQIKFFQDVTVKADQLLELHPEESLELATRVITQVARLIEALGTTDDVLEARTLLRGMFRHAGDQLGAVSALAIDVDGTVSYVVRDKDGVELARANVDNPSELLDGLANWAKEHPDASSVAQA